MSEEYRRAVEILEAIQPHPPNIWIARFWSSAAFAEEKQANLDQARDYYERAVEEGKGVAGVEELAGWQEALDRLREGNP